MLTLCTNKTFHRGILFFAFSIIATAPSFSLQGSPQTASADVAKVLGTIQSMSGNAIVVKKDDGAETNVTVQDGTRLAQVAPGQKDLKSATPIQLHDVQIGDRVLVRGKMSSDGKTILAATVLAMKKSDLEAKQQAERQDWQRRGVGGVVTSVDPASGTLAISVASFREKKTVTIHTTKDTIVRRYAPDSVKFDDAKIGTFDQIKAGDQLRARGTRSTDGNELTAVEIVSGTFRNIAGTIAGSDAGANTLNVMDLASKRQVTVRVTGESLVRKLPPEMAQRIAMRLRGMNGASEPAPANPPAKGTRQQAVSQSAGEHVGGMGASARPGGPPDFQQMLSRLPPATVSDFQKGEAVMIVSTQGAASGEVTAITLLGGVEAILAAPNGSEAMRLSPWTLGSGGGGEEAAQ
jgi:hypothetical protein